MIYCGQCKFFTLTRNCEHKSNIRLDYSGDWHYKEDAVSKNYHNDCEYFELGKMQGLKNILRNMNY